MAGCVRGAGEYVTKIFKVGGVVRLVAVVRWCVRRCRWRGWTLWMMGGGPLFRSAPLGPLVALVNG